MKSTTALETSVEINTKLPTWENRTPSLKLCSLSLFNTLPSTKFGINERMLNISQSFGQLNFALQQSLPRLLGQVVKAMDF